MEEENVQYAAPKNANACKNTDSNRIAVVRVRNILGGKIGRRFVENSLATPIIVPQRFRLPILLSRQTYSPNPNKTGEIATSAIVALEDQVYPVPETGKVKPTRRQVTAAVRQNRPMKSKFPIYSRRDLRGTGLS